MSNDLVNRRWRTGRKVYRTIYAVMGDEPSDYDILIGLMDSASLATEAVRAHNRALEQQVLEALREHNRRGGYQGSEPVELPPPPRTLGASVNP